MIDTIIKHTIFFIGCFYIFSFIIGQKGLFKEHLIKNICFSLILCIETLSLKMYYPELSYFVPAFTFFIFVYLTFAISLKDSLTFSILSYGISLAIFEALLFSFLLIVSPFNPPSTEIFFKVCTIIVSFIYALTLFALSKYKRFSAGMPFVQSGNLINLGCIISILVLTIITHEQITSYSLSYKRLLRMLFTFIFTVIIIYWWKKQITKSYKDKLCLLELKNLRTSKLENEAYIASLENENKRLGTIIHKDNRIVNAMADSVCAYLSSSADLSAESLQTKGQALSEEINSIKTYRQELLCQGSQSGSSIPQTNHAGVDAIISFMVKEASTYGISLKFHYDTDFFAAKRFTATEMDFVHLLSDLLENAVIATRHCNGKSIELSFQILKGTPAISVSDSGIPFEIDTYMKFGTCEASTHTDDGGTGIGLIDIWSFKKKYHASLVIEELDDSIYSKRLSLLFDNRNKYLVISNRHQEIVSCQTRSDLMVINRAENVGVELGEE